MGTPPRPSIASYGICMYTVSKSFTKKRTELEARHYVADIRQFCAGASDVPRTVSAQSGGKAGDIPGLYEQQRNGPETGARAGKAGQTG